MGWTRRRRSCGAPSVCCPLSILSGDTSTEGISEIAASGFQIMHKPIAPEALRRNLARLLSEIGQIHVVAQKQSAQRPGHQEPHNLGKFAKSAPSPPRAGNAS